MDKMRITFILILTCIIIVGTTCLAATGVVGAQRGLVLREEASKDANPLTTVPDDAAVEILGKEGEWYKAKYGTYEGYLFAEFVKVDEEEITPTNNTQDAEQNGSVFNTNIKGYLLPSITSKVILEIEQGKAITVNYELGNWANITCEGKGAWVRRYYLNTENQENTQVTNQDNVKEEQPEEAENKNIQEEPKEEKQSNTETKIENKKGYINVTSAANVRESASTSATIINTLLRNTEVTITAESGDFYKIQYQDITGYVAKSLISDNPVEATSRTSSGERNSENATAEENESNEKENINEEAVNIQASSSEGQRIADFAKQYKGCNYVSGGTTPSGFDCTGFAYYVYNSCGYSLGRLCSEQSKSGMEVGKNSRDELQAGDLLLFSNGSNGSIGHVGIYIGDGYFIHAKNSNSGVVIDHLTNNPYYNQYYYSGRRIVD